MKKVIVCILVTWFVLLFTAINTHATNRDSSLLEDFLKEVEEVLAVQRIVIQDVFLDQNELSLKGREEDLRDFLKKVSSEKNSNLENYQQGYLSRLTKAKNTLMERNLEDFEKKKEEELRTEIGQDVEDYLEELLNEK
ncbi:hypothetical protein ACFSTA_07595 [Ornithinibacillus salinisoli]|uniref:Uncharacterized protein n=1 Tax=Ornithinibacillus salinisoli TaxID=1848459 RepID=A0ABW4VYT5_9BACI